MSSEKSEVSVLKWLCLQGQAEKTGTLKNRAGACVGSTLVEVNTKMIAALRTGVVPWAGRLRQGEKKTLTHSISLFPLFHRI